MVTRMITRFAGLNQRARRLEWHSHVYSIDYGRRSASVTAAYSLKKPPYRGCAALFCFTANGTRIRWES